VVRRVSKVNACVFMGRATKQKRPRNLSTGGASPFGVLRGGPAWGGLGGSKRQSDALLPGAALKTSPKPRPDSLKTSVRSSRVLSTDLLISRRPELESVSDQERHLEGHEDAGEGEGEKAQRRGIELEELGDGGGSTSRRSSVRPSNSTRVPRVASYSAARQTDSMLYSDRRDNSTSGAPNTHEPRPSKDAPLHLRAEEDAG
jgi:hypothetical protein